MAKCQQAGGGCLPAITGFFCIVSRKKRKCPPERPSDEERLRGGWDPRRRVWRGTFFRKAAPWETVDAFFEALLWFVVVSSPQCGENTAFFSGFPFGGSHGSGILPVVPLELEKSIGLFLRFSPWRAPLPRHFSDYPFGISRKKASAIFYNTAFFEVPKEQPIKRLSSGSANGNIG